MWRLLPCVLMAAVAGTAPALAEPPPAPPDFQGPTTVPLTLAEARTRALASHPDAIIARALVEAARARRDGALAAWEPWLEAGWIHDASDTPSATAQDGAADDSITGSGDGLSLGLAEATPLGTELGLQLRHTRTASTSGTAVAPQTWRSALEFRLRQPLLRGFGFDPRVPLAGALEADADALVAAEEAATALAALVESVEGAYWDLRLALSSWSVHASSTETARRQLELTERQIRDGVLPPSDRIQAESTLARRELQEIQSRALIESATDRLRALLRLPSARWEEHILPVDEPPDAGAPPALDEGIDAARLARPELRAERARVDVAALGLRLARNALLPGFDLDLSLGLVGQDSESGKSLQALGTGRGWNWSLGFSLRWGPLSRAGAAGLHAARAMERIAEARLSEREEALALEVRAVHRSWTSAREQAAAAARFRALAERSLDVEERRFKDGFATNFLVAAREDEVRQARLAELEARVALARSRVAWARATGALQRDLARAP
jgi:outer membrane protein TolC